MNKTINGRVIIRNSLIFAVVVGLLLSVDLLLKNYFFEYIGNDVTGNEEHNWGVVGIRSFAHTNSTFLSFLNISMSDWIKVMISAIIASILTIWLMLSDSKFKTVSIAIMIAGILGNTFDNIFYGYVRDILFTPWWDRGTFNLGDILVVAGSLLLVVALFRDIFKKS